MTGAEVIAIVQQKLGFRTDKVAQILVELNEAMRLEERGRTLPKFLLEEDETLSLTADVNYVALPEGFIKVHDDGHPHYTSDDVGQIWLERAPWDSIQKLYATAEAGSPRAYTVRQTRVYVAPTPDKALDLTWSYYKKGEAITDGGENTWLADDAGAYLLGAIAGRKIAAAMHAKEAYVEFVRMETEWRRALFGETVEDETQGPVIMGGDL